MTDISLKFPDGSVRDYKRGMTGAALAESISKSLAKKAVALMVDGELRDLADPIEAEQLLPDLGQPLLDAVPFGDARLPGFVTRCRHGELRWHPAQLLVQRDPGRRSGAGPRRIVEMRMQLPDASLAGSATVRECRWC